MSKKPAKRGTFARVLLQIRPYWPIVALLLPMVNYNTGHMVMERVKARFYQKYPNCSVAFNYRIGPLSSEAGEPRLPESAQN